MSNLKHRQQKIQEKRKKTPWREFLKEICTTRSVTLFKNNGHISRYPSSERHGKLVDIEKYNEYVGDFTSYGIDIGEHFFETFTQLFHDVPFSYLLDYGGNENAEYADLCYRSKNCYLSSIVINDCKDICYSYNIKDNSEDIFSSMMVWNNSQNIYMSMGVINSYNIFYSRYISDCSDVWFSDNMIGCQHCIFCSGLTNQSYCINNKELDKKEYVKEKTKILQQKQKFPTYLSKIHKKGQNVGCVNVTGNFCQECEELDNGYNCYQLSHENNCMLAGGPSMKNDLYDVFSVGAGEASSGHFYGACGVGLGSNHIYCSTDMVTCQHVFYSINLENCSYCLGCIGLRNKSFCIFNKQYTKEERHQKVDEIFSAMEKDGTLGNFFPGWMNPFYFNDTAAYLIDDSFTKEEVEAEGYLWRDEPIKVDIPAGVQTVGIDELGKYEGWKEVQSGKQAESGKLQAASKKGELEDGSLELDAGAKRYIDPEILKKVIVDEAGNAYRIIPMEYDFLMKYGLPLPRKHWLERLKGHFRVK